MDNLKKTVPVIHDAPREAMNRIASATSAGWPLRPRGSKALNAGPRRRTDGAAELLHHLRGGLRHEERALNSTTSVAVAGRLCGELNRRP
ncbi:hypothetical protein QF000_000815 [Paraburkholderia atlantica]|uniref:Uncharacterized protein n=2 Tax=Paraburkholderia TaxID=1822464 RepID=A0A7W8LHJ0_9BURK|nr:hypothetical protein [Paraburkholderia youngii]MBB5421482.1 hypothetical protein [Paraburkholderia atlantica]MBB5429616.1 hypothetical protein [Paraburkholderia atlantica]